MSASAATRGPHRWTSDAIARARVLWREGLPAAAIGARFGVSKNAITGVADRHEFPSRAPGGRPRRPYPDEPRQHSPRQPKPIALVRAPLVTLEALAAMPASPPRVVPLPPERACCWPLGEPGAPGFRFCADPAAPGRQRYCAAHQAIGHRYVG